MILNVEQVGLKQCFKYNEKYWRVIHKSDLGFLLARQVVKGYEYWRKTQHKTFRYGTKVERNLYEQLL